MEDVTETNYTLEVSYTGKNQRNAAPRASAAECAGNARGGGDVRSRGKHPVAGLRPERAT